MARQLQQIQDEIHALSTSDKEILLRALWEDLDGPADADVDALWLEEAKRRDAELDAGTSESIAAADVFAQLRASLKR
jgi:hypothetical protein